MRSNATRVCGTMIVAMGLLALLGADGRKQVTVAELQNGTDIIGSLGKRLGTYVKIEGKAPVKTGMLSKPLEVDMIDGKKLDPPVLIEIQTGKELQGGDRYSFRGYETGAMNSMPKDPDDPRHEPQQIYSFAVWFVSRDVK